LNDNTRNPLLSHYVGLFLTSLFFNCCYLLAFGHAKIDEVQLKTIPGSNAHHFFMGCTKDEEFFPSGKRRSIPRFTYDE
jgi:hypothetical protein